MKLDKSWLNKQMDKLSDRVTSLAACRSKKICFQEKIGTEIFKLLPLKKTRFIGLPVHINPIQLCILSVKTTQV